jgi:hypothetical protein
VKSQAEVDGVEQRVSGGAGGGGGERETWIGAGRRVMRETLWPPDQPFRSIKMWT